MEHVDNDHQIEIHISKQLLVVQFDHELNDHVVHRLTNFKEEDEQMKRSSKEKTEIFLPISMNG